MWHRGWAPHVCRDQGSRYSMTSDRPAHSWLFMLSLCLIMTRSKVWTNRLFMCRTHEVSVPSSVCTLYNLIDNCLVIVPGFQVWSKKALCCIRTVVLTCSGFKSRACCPLHDVRIFAWSRSVLATGSCWHQWHCGSAKHSKFVQELNVFLHSL